MKDHTWGIEEVDGGTLGLADFWVCRVCGAAGGPDLSNGKRIRPSWYDPNALKLQSIPHALFLAGTGISLSLDCDEARQQAREYVLDKIDRMGKRKSISPHYASLLKDAVVWSSDKTDWGVILDICRDICGPSRPKYMAVRHRLVEAGYNVTPPALAEAVVALAGLMGEGPGDE